MLIGLGAAVLVLLLAVGGLGIALVARGGDDEPDIAAPAPSTGTTADPGNGETPGTEPSAEAPPPVNNNAVTAKYSSDFEEVCSGGAILNAADYKGGVTTKAYAFSNAPDQPTSWRTRSVGYDKPFYAKSADFTTVSMVVCLTTAAGSEGTPKKCEYTDRDDKKVQIDYISSRLDVAFFAAKTGQRVGTGGQINAPANKCPSYISYNRTTLQAYAAPDEGAITAAIEKFLAG